MVAIHHVYAEIHHQRRSGARYWLIWFVWFVSFIWLSKTNKRNQIDQTNRELPLSQTLGYSHNWARLEKP